MGDVNQVFFRLPKSRLFPTLRWCLVFEGIRYMPPKHEYHWNLNLFRLGLFWTPQSDPRKTRSQTWIESRHGEGYHLAEGRVGRDGFFLHSLAHVRPPQNKIWGEMLAVTTMLLDVICYCVIVPEHTAGDWDTPLCPGIARDRNIGEVRVVSGIRSAGSPRSFSCLGVLITVETKPTTA